MNKIFVTAILALALIGVVDARSSSSSGSRSSSRSSGISLSKSPAPSRSAGISLAKPSVTPAPATKGINVPKPVMSGGSPPTQSRSWFSRSTPTPSSNRTVTIVHEHHYFGGGYGYGHGYYGGYSGGFGSSPFFWLWLLDRPHQQAPIVVNGQVGGATGSYAPAPVESSSGAATFFNVVLGLLMLTGITALVVWIVRKIFFSK